MSRLLLVEDDEGIREALKDGLEAYGYSVIAVGCMAGAMEALEREAITHVLSDGTFPAFNDREPAEYGPDLLAFARKAGLRTLLYTGADELVEQERQAGGKALVKPASLVTLVEMLDGQP